MSYWFNMTLNEPGGGVAMVSNELMTTKELAQYLQLDRMTIYKLLKTGDIPANRVGHQWRFFRSDIDEWIRSKKVDLNTIQI